ncbi:MAG: GntR family transcriptional regulator [Gemmiger sp.]|nr:GntR family transcriptional regulator [Gemmiger sp.]
MEWEIIAGRPVYLQLIEQLELAVLTGIYPPGARLPGVRELAGEAGVNPNTMQRALQELEGRGLLTTQRTAGRNVTADTKVVAALKNQRAASLTATYLHQMQSLGCTVAEITALLQQQAAKT